MHGHLVTVEVGVVRRTNERVKVNRFTFDQHRFEGLNAQAVQRRCAVEQDRMLANHFVEHVPHFRAHAFDHAFRALDVVRLSAIDQLLHHERLEELERHLFGKTALMQLQRRTDDDNRTARVVDALAEQILTETPLLTFEDVAERFERTVVRPRYRTAAASIVDKRIDRFLQHAFFVLDDDLRRAEFEQPLQTVVAVDDAAVEIVQVRRREAAAVELHHRAQFRRDHRHRRENHPLRLVTGIQKRFDHFKTLDSLEPLLSGRLFELFAQLFLEAAQVQIAQKIADRFRAHAGLERRSELVAIFAILLLREHFAFLQRRAARIDYDVRREINNFFELARRHVEQNADAAGHALEVPNMAYGRCELDMAHALAANFRARDLHAAAIADHAFEADPLILAAVAFPVFGGPEDLFAEQAVAFGLEGAIVDGFRFLDLAERPSTDLFGRSKSDAHRIEIVDVD